MSTRTKVLVVDDNAVLRLGLCGAISVRDNFNVVGEASNGAEALEKVRELSPDVVTMDYQMPGDDGVETSRKILKEFPEIKIILLSVRDAEDDIWKAVQVGVKGYLTKQAGEIEDVLEAIDEVGAGGTFFPANIVRKLETRKNLKDLSDTELKVLKLVSDGLSNKEIGDQLGMSLPMVKLSVVNLREKLSATDRTQAVVKAVQLGILQLEGYQDDR